MQNQNHEHHLNEHHHEKNVISDARLATSATLHCLLGCGLGEIVGMLIAMELGLAMVPSIALAVSLGFVLGFILGMRPLRKHGYSFINAFKAGASCRRIEHCFYGNGRSVGGSLYTRIYAGGII